MPVKEFKEDEMYAKIDNCKMVKEMKTCGIDTREFDNFLSQYKNNPMISEIDQSFVKPEYSNVLDWMDTDWEYPGNGLIERKF